MTGVNFSSWFNPEQGCLFAEGTGLHPTVTAAFQIDNGTASNRMTALLSLAGSQVPAVVIAGGSSQTSFSNVTFTTNDRISLSYAANNISACLNGGTVQNETVAVIPVVDRLRIMNNAQASASGYIKRLTYYPQALTAANLQAITR
jgi:hypothetical protein